jgi:superfamily II DNA helicase RecQ
MAGFMDVLRIVVATTAFGTGINFSDIRIIVHYGLPSSLTEYMQNIGRGGRDGEPYKCVLYFSYKTIHEQGAVWMQGCPTNELPFKWEKFVEKHSFYPTLIIHMTHHQCVTLATLVLFQMVQRLALIFKQLRVS